MKFKRIISSILALITVIGSVGITAITPVFAEEKTDWSKVNFTTQKYQNENEKLATMTLEKEENGYQIWIQEYTGEVAFRNVVTGETLFTNPYDISLDTYDNIASISTKNKEKLLSQIILTYLNNTTGEKTTMNSYVEAAKRSQIFIYNIKGGIRVEYMMGEQNTTRLVPRMISKERYEELILPYLQQAGSFYVKKFKGFFTLQDPTDPDKTKSEIADMYEQYPITKEMPVYVCTTDITSAELAKLESYMKKCCSHYTYDDLNYDHELTGYVANDEAPPLFRFALEYTIQSDGSLEVRLPASSIRYDETAYALQDISILPYFGVGSNDYTGYVFLPDGSGTLYRYEDLIGINYKYTSKIYGDDYAYHTLYTSIQDSLAHSETIRYPVFGAVTNIDRVEYTYDSDGKQTSSTEVKKDTGYVAIITEGDSLTTLVMENGGIQTPYLSIYANFTPHPSDSYNLADSISVVENTTQTVTSDSKFTGSYRIRYFMLQDDTICADNGVEEYYETSYVGMANAYRDYLYTTNQLVRYTEKDVGDSIPLIIESFGSMETTERVLSFPVVVDTALTTFDDIKTMYDELASNGITNINFKLTGFANGGMKSTVPYKLSWVDACGGAKGFEDLLTYANQKGFGVYPEFDFVYSSHHETFDGFSMKNHAIRTIDNRYTRKQVYDAATQSFVMGGMIGISASVYNYFFEKFSSNYSKYNPMGISVSTLGTDLNSDFDEDDPYNREECKEYTVELLENLNDKYGKVIVDGGNAYTFAYSDIILDVSTDSSKYFVASEAVPFLGIVLHGAKVCTGEPINMEGDVYYAILKAIENGYYLNFILSYRNTQYMKDDVELSKYYSVQFEYWEKDLIEYYNILNNATADLQTSLIVDHEFLSGSRIPDADEVIADADALKALIDARIEYLYQQAIKEEKATRLENGTEKGLPFDNVQRLETLDPSQYTTEINNLIAAQEERYKVSSGTVSRVEYENNVSFIFNYNNFDVEVEYNGQTYTISALNFVRIDG